MRCGRLRHLITIETPSGTRDESGSVANAWTDFATVWASIEPLEGRELVEARQVTALVTHAIKTRYKAGVTTAMRCKFGTRILNIASVLNVDERSRELVLRCVERTA